MREPEVGPPVDETDLIDSLPWLLDEESTRLAACRRSLVARLCELRQGKKGDRETAQAAFLAAEHGSTSLTPPWRSSRSRSREYSDRLLERAERLKQLGLMED